jgi:hypothetical protein
LKTDDTVASGESYRESPLATASSVSGGSNGTIANDFIADADINASAGIGTSKLSGPVTSISGHGLGTLAALSAVGSAEITNSSIVDADISASAAISSTKICFSNDAISGDKVEGGTSLSDGWVFFKK